MTAAPGSVRMIPRKTAAAIARACVDAGVPEAMVEVFATSTTAEHAAERICAAQEAKKIVPFPARSDPEAERPAITAAMLKTDMIARLARAGARADWSDLEAS